MSTRERRPSRLERQLVDLARREEQRLGQDLHDGLCQALSGIKFQAGSLAHQLGTARSPHAREAADIERRLADAIRQARDMARGLAPPELELGELTTALRHLAACVKREFGLECACKCSGVPQTIEPDFACHLYRIVREAVLNAAKHSQGQRISVRLSFRAGRFLLRIDNDGLKFQPPPGNHDGLGLRLMQCRARVLGAVLEVQPGSRGGCTIRCAGPLPPGRQAVSRP